MVRSLTGTAVTLWVEVGAKVPSGRGGKEGAAVVVVSRLLRLPLRCHLQQRERRLATHSVPEYRDKQ